jgi:hypothetical protein
MKKNVLIALIILCSSSIFIGCSSDSDKSDSDSNSTNSDLKVQFTLVGYNDYQGSYDILNYFNTKKESNGTTTYHLNSRVDRKGIDSDDKAHVTLVFELWFNATESLKAGQIFNLSKNNVTGIIGDGFPVSNNDPIGGPGSYCGYLGIEFDNTTVGQIKITSVNGDRISGEFYFNNLHNYYTDGYYNKCSQLSMPAQVNISKGAFLNVQIE